VIEAATRALADLVAFPSVSSDSNLDIIHWLAERLETSGARVEVMPDTDGQKANLWATLGPERHGGIVLSGHTDVVPVTDQVWSSDPFVLTERDGRLFGRGTCDMKGFLAACITLAPVFAAQVRDRPLHFAFTYDEEVGCLGGIALAHRLKARGLRPHLAIVGEPTEMRLIDGHKGCCEYTTRFHGLEGHGSDPGLGVNAVEYAARFATHLMTLRSTLRDQRPNNSPFDPPHTTLNIGALNGGSVHNVIAPKASVAWEMRPVTPEDAAFVKAEVNAYVNEILLAEMRLVHPDAAITTEVVGEVIGLQPRPDNAARDLMARLTGANSTDVVPFGTEAGLFQDIGMDVVVCGPGAIAQAHKADEYLAIDQLAMCLTALEKLGEGLKRK